MYSRYFVELDAFMYAHDGGVPEQLRAWAVHRKQRQEEEDLFNDEDDNYIPPSGSEYSVLVLGGCANYKVLLANQIMKKNKMIIVRMRKFFLYTPHVQQAWQEEWWRPTTQGDLQSSR